MDAARKQDGPRATHKDDAGVPRQLVQPHRRPLRRCRAQRPSDKSRNSKRGYMVVNQRQVPES
jgi:hypothetical protein